MFDERQHILDKDSDNIVILDGFTNCLKLRKEGLDGHEKIKSYMCVYLLISSSEVVDLSWLCNTGSCDACYAVPYLIYAASHRAKHVTVMTLVLIFGAMTMTWICDKISESGFVISQGMSLHFSSF
ncbi:unnamed protein product [Fraxinus pennsylvanica]|uniref:Uncharacterized protein n=1 Tax=Fraxinus pennsylvanica TaxID=56036 RepID=A0AAD1ZR28_9LAMI|nr:unnamed protein product [Fraxinus pennsylvanica]